MNKLVKSAVVLAAVLGLTTVAHAVPTLTISDGTSVETFSSASGIVSSGAISMDNWSVIITTGETAPALGSASSPAMDVDVQASSTGAGTLYITFSATGFTGAGTLQINQTGHIVSGASETVEESVYGNTANVLGSVNASGTLVTPGTLIGSTGVLSSSPFSALVSGALPNTSPYALTEEIVLTTSGTSSTSLDGSFSSSVPDGGSTITLLGSALAGLGLIGTYFKRR